MQIIQKIKVVNQIIQDPNQLSQIASLAQAVSTKMVQVSSTI